MFLLIPHDAVKKEEKRLHLHSTMFLLILFPEFNPELNLFNLHSTMFLLIPVATPLLTACTIIYIPLCFYLYGMYRYMLRDRQD